MNLETFFEKFELFADAPDAVAKMRELVLRLAFSGGLTGKRPSEASIPEGWENRTIESISASISSGFACSRSHQMENGHVHLRTHNISTLGTLNFDLLVRIDPKMVDPQKASIRAGDILFNNTNSQELVGKTSLVDCDYDYGFSNHITRIRLKDGIFPGFVVFYLTLLRNSGYFARLCTRWINQAAVNADTLKEQTIPLPPLAEQKRIVAKVDELMALCDRLEAQQQEREAQASQLARASLARFAEAPTPANLPFLFHSSFSIPPSDLRKSILTLAVQGKLVPQDPNDEPAEKLFAKIQRERAEQEAKGAYKSSRPLEPIEETEAPFDLPVKWKWARLRSLVFTLGDGLHGTPEYSNGTDCYFINGNNLVDGQIVIKHNTKTVSLDEAKKHRKPMTLSTVLVSINGTLGSVAFYNNENVILGKSACYFNLSSLVDKHFVRRVIESPYFVNYASENATGTTIRNLGLKAMNYFPFPLPPLAEQRRIVAKVEQLMALVDALETQLAASRATAANLLAAIVAELTTSS